MARSKNSRLKKANTQTEFTPELVQELLRCVNDPIYFIERYVYIRGVDGKALFKMYEYQKDIIRAYLNNSHTIILASRQVGKTETSAAFILWFAIFHPDKFVLIASNKSDNAKEIIGKIVYAYEELPDWLKPGIDESSWNKFSIAFENKSRVLAATTAEDTGRGLAIDLLYVDELAFVKAHIQDTFYASIFPVLSSRVDGKMIISSTPNGDVNLFAELWRGAENDTNGFKSVRVPWYSTPGRTEEFKAKTIKKLGERKWLQEYECHFLSSDHTLIDTYVVNQIEERNKKDNIQFEFKIAEQGFWKKINKKSTYIVGVDVSQGLGQDYSVIEVFEFPSLEQVMEYRTNEDSPAQLYKYLKNILIYLDHYGGDVFFSVENNGLGQAIIAVYEADERAPNAMFISEKGKEKGRSKVGFNTSGQSKPKSCLILKEMITRNSIKIYSEILLRELKSFVRKSGSYEAQTGATDDCIMATLIVLRILEEISSFDENAYQKLYTNGLEEIEKDLNGEYVTDEWSIEDDDESLRNVPMIFI